VAHRINGNPRLHELVIESGLSVSPYVWRIRYALAHKGITFDSLPVSFTGIARLHGGTYKTVPILEYGDTILADSWQIAEHLDAAFPASPALFSSHAELATVRLTDAWFLTTIQRKLFDIYVLDIHNAVRPEDRAYFRQSREQRLNGVTLETHTAARHTQLPALRAALLPLRTQLSRFPYLGGSAPNFADYIALGAFHWIANVATLPLLSRDDTLRTWLERGFDLYDGIGRQSRLQSLFETG
jgi:glutathione S-transferase